MPGFLSKIFGAAASPFVDSVGKIIDNLNTSDKEKLDARIALAAAERLFNKDLLDADAQTVAAQAGVITAEVKSDSWLARNWRPILMLTFTFIIAWNYAVVPILSIWIKLAPATIPLEMWDILKLGVGGYVVGRSIEKTATTLVPILQAKINTK